MDWKTFDFLGLFHEGGVLGLDILGLDHTSEDAMEEAEKALDKANEQFQQQLSTSIDKSMHNAAYVFGASMLFLFIIYAFNKGWIKW